MCIKLLYNMRPEDPQKNIVPWGGSEDSPLAEDLITAVREGYEHQSLKEGSPPQVGIHGRKCSHRASLLIEGNNGSPE